MPGFIHSPVLIGRTRELEILDQALGAARKGAGGCILLAGEAGIGKSRLAAEARDRATAGPFVILQGHCSEQDRTYPYAPWIDALRAFLASLSRKQVGECLGVFAPELVKLLPELSLLLPSIQPTPSLDPTAEKHRLFESLTRFAASLAAAHPLLIILEDLHWSDEPSLEFMHFLLRRSATLPILVLGTYRGEDSSSRLAYHLLELYRAHLAEEIQISPLTRREVIEMAQAILRTEGAIHPRWLDRLVLFSEGNPFFVEEMIKSLREPAAAPQERDPLPISRGIQKTVERRIEGLADGTRRVLSLASVIGERFDFGLLQEVAAEDEQTLLRQLRDLIAAQVIVEKGEDQFAFWHALTREAVYATLMLRERKAIHRTIGETLERQAGGRADAPAAPLAYHFYHAGVWQKAMAYALGAGEKAQALYAPREALTHFSHALDAARELGIPPPLSGLRGRAHAREVLGDFDGARVDHEAVLESAGHGTDRVDEWQALIDLGFLWQSRDLERAGQYYQLALGLARNLGDSAILAQSLNRVGNWHVNRGDAREALPFHHEALTLLEELGDRHGMAGTMELLAIVSNRLGDVIQGRAYLEQAIPILRHADDRQALVNTLTNLANLAHFETEVLGELNYQRLADLSEEALQLARGFDWNQGEVRALIPGAMSLAQVGQYARALAWLGRANAVMETIRHRESFARLQLTSGQILIELLALPEAQQRLEAGLALSQELGAEFLALGAIARLATAAVLSNDLAQAGQLLDAWLPDEFPDGQLPIHLRRLWSGRAELDLAQGKAHSALEIVQRLLASTANLGQHGPHSVPYLSRLRARALAALGHLEDAEAELQGTLPVASSQGQRWMLWRLHADLGSVYRAMGRRDAAEREFSAARTIVQGLADNVPAGSLRENFLAQALSALPAAPALTPRQFAKKEFGGLTAREREVAALISQGKSNREIADELVIAETTADRHVANILSKLGFDSRIQIALWAAARGLRK